jgi:hypothetical protein
MAHGPEHHLEEAEHSSHASAPLDRKVAMTIAIIAAGLACVAMISHRVHTQTLLLQSLANTKHTEASDAWNFYQAKNIRSYEFQSFLMADMIQGKKSGTSVEKRIRDYWIGQVNKYEGEYFWPEMEAYLEGKSDKRPRREEGKGSELKRLEEDARHLVKEARHNEEASIHVHHSANWLDFGHLAIELALVLASVAILTKQRGFWYVGIAVAIAGGALAFLGIHGLYIAGH